MQYTNDNGEPVHVRDAARLGDTSFVLVGRTLNPGGTSNNMVQLVVDGHGNPLWGGWSDLFNGDELRRVKRASDGSALACGYNWGLSATYGYSVRIGSTPGTYSASLRRNPTNGPMVAVIVEMLPTSDGGFVGVGIDFGLLVYFKADAAGTVLWSRSIPIGGPDFSAMHAVEGDGGSTYIATEAFGTFFRLIKVDDAGAVLWSMNYEMPGSDRPFGMTRFTNGDLWICGASWLMACDAYGDVLWARDLPHTALVMEATPEENGVFLTGFEGADGWIMRTDANGVAPDCASSLFTPLRTSEALVASSAPSLVPVSPLLDGMQNADSDALPAVTPGCLPSVVSSVVVDAQAMHVFPNPFHREARVIPPAPHDEVQLVDALGSVVISMPTQGCSDVVLSRGGLPAGLYLVRVLHNGVSTTAQRVLVE